MRFSAAVKAYRASLGLSLAKCAKQIGITRTALDRFEQGKEVEGRQWVKVFLWLLDQP
jgi:transcriptional regulator with XRE-family HTH domain